MIKVRLTSPLWAQNDGVYAKGEAFFKDEFKTAEDLALLFKEVKTEQQFKDTIKLLNGIFSVIVLPTENSCLATTGIANATQLFYTFDKDCITICDDGYTLAAKNWELNTKAARNYHLLNYIPGNETLAEGVFKIEPLKYLIIADGKAEQKRHFSYLLKKGEEFNLSPKELQDEFLRVLNNTFDRVVEAAKGRQIVLSLSAGLDSRLIACMLKQKGINDAICYTVGQKNDYEVTIARQVAEKLGYTHYSFSNDEFSLNPDNKEHLQYLRYAGNMCNMLWTFEYNAVLSLINNKIIGKDAVFIPGHSADVLAGSFITYAGLSRTSDKKETAKKISGFKTIKKYDREVMSATANHLPNDWDNYEAWSIFDNYLLENRLTRNIAISCRLYEYLGAKYLLPYYDSDFVEFFRKLPLEHKKGECFYRNSSTEHIFKPFGVDFAIQEISIASSKKQRIKDRIKAFMPPSMLQLLLPKAKDLSLLGMVNSLLIDDVLKEKPILYSNLQNEITSLWYIKHCKEF